MKTYAEENGKELFDWNEFLDRALKGEGNTIEWKKAVDLALNWITCACGNQCSIIPRDWTGRPIDASLYNLGVWFSDYIESKDFIKAKETLTQIEERSAYLINQINNGKDSRE